MEELSWHSKGWLAYMAALLLFNLLIWSGPFLSMSNSPLAPPLYDALHYTCHQMDSRSICLYPSGNGGKFIDDCTVQDGKLYFERNMVVYSAEKYHLQETFAAGPAGYKVPVCSRDIAIYGAMLLGGLLWLLAVRRKWLRAGDWPHPFWLIVALIPLALDGFTQLFGWRESTNELRLLTGALAGLAMAFYALPAFYMLLDAPKKGKKTPASPSVPAPSAPASAPGSQG
ncbi:MAG: DUF2085 domain-containing protein [Candidatus Marsarchaeota archaeon]|nr:DUF2085 domain-containing protein [Candidatus Marsarchaeota archaeon]